MSIGGEDVFLYEPLALEYLAAGVGSGHEVRILDLRLENELDWTLDCFAPDVVGITAYTVHVNVVRRLFDRIKARDPLTLTVVGGHHATVSPGDFLSPSIDVVVRGEGVEPFRELVDRRARGRTPVGVPGTICRTADGAVESDPVPVADLDALPFPDRSLTRRYRRHYYSEWMQPLASIRTSRGCPFRCRFCAEWKIAGGRYFRRAPEKVVEELATIDEDWVFFADDESLVDAGRMGRLAELIRRAGIRKRYFCYGRSDTIVKSRDLLTAWRDIGLERIFVGLEFIGDEDLAYVRKRSTARDNEAAVRILQDLGIDVYASFMVRPEFRRDDFAALKDYCRRLGLDFATFAVLTPLPGTDLWSEVQSRLTTRNYDLFDFLHAQLPTALSLPDFHAELDGLYAHAIPPGRQLARLRKYRLSRIPGLLSTSRRIHRRLREAYKDYGN